MIQNPLYLHSDYELFTTFSSGVVSYIYSLAFGLTLYIRYNTAAHVVNLLEVSIFRYLYFIETFLPIIIMHYHVFLTEKYLTFKDLGYS